MKIRNLILVLVILILMTSGSSLAQATPPATDFSITGISMGTGYTLSALDWRVNNESSGGG